jgi:hypothetical protein
MWILGGLFGATLIALMILLVVRSGKGKKERVTSASSPGPPAVGYAAMPGSPAGTRATR